MMKTHGWFVGLCLCLSHISALQVRTHMNLRPAIPDQTYLAESFDASLERNWVLSKAVKDEQQNIKYDGQWAVEELLGNRGLVLKSPGRHHAISANLQNVYYFKDKPLCLQYEVFFQKGVDCGGGYIKLLSHSDGLRLSQFSDATPYTIIFGPDKCGSTHKVHFIFRHLNPITGTYEEKHTRQPEMDLSHYFTDQRPHLYTLNLYPNNTFEIFIDMTMINKGSLLEHMDPSVASLCDKEDPEDTKTDSLLDRFHISDQNEKSNDTDGECTEHSACEHRTPPILPNPASNKQREEPMETEKAEKWTPHKGKHFEGACASRLSPVAAVGFELWSLTGDVMFDNILLCDSLELAKRWTEDTWGQRRTVSSGHFVLPRLVEQLLAAAVNRPWLWGVYVFTVGLPLILFVSLMWPEKRFGPPDMDYYYKKTDDPQTDGQQDMEGHTAHNNGPNQIRPGAKRRDIKRIQKKSDLDLKL